MLLLFLDALSLSFTIMLHLFLIIIIINKLKIYYEISGIIKLIAGNSHII